MRGKDPHPQDFSVTKKTARFTKGLTKEQKNQMLNLVLGVGVFSLLPISKLPRSGLKRFSDLENPNLLK